MQTVKLVTNDGNGMPREIPFRNGATLGELLNISFDGDIEDFNVTTREDGQASRTWESDDLDDVLLVNGMKITLSPRKVEGA